MIGDLIGEWIKGILIDGIMGNLSRLFNTVNTKVGEIASDVGSTPRSSLRAKTTEGSSKSSNIAPKQ